MCILEGCRHLHTVRLVSESSAGWTQGGLAAGGGVSPAAFTEGAFPAGPSTSVVDFCLERNISPGGRSGNRRVQEPCCGEHRNPAAHLSDAVTTCVDNLLGQEQGNLKSIRGKRPMNLKATKAKMPRRRGAGENGLHLVPDACHSGVGKK